MHSSCGNTKSRQYWGLSKGRGDVYALWIIGSASSNDCATHRVVLSKMNCGPLPSVAVEFQSVVTKVKAKVAPEGPGTSSRMTMRGLEGTREKSALPDCICAAMMENCTSVGGQGRAVIGAAIMENCTTLAPLQFGKL